MKQELDNAQKVERYTLKQKYAAQLIEKEKELEAITMEMHATKGIAAFWIIADKRASLTVDISTINAKLKNIQQGRPIMGYPDVIDNNYFLKKPGV